jgi:hypothetical protein
VELRRDDLVRAAGNRNGRRADRLATVERELRQTQAEALGRTGERLRDLLERLAQLDCRLDALRPDASGPGVDANRVRAEVEIRNRLRDEAMRMRHHLIIQREALGFVRPGSVEQCYPVPGRRPVPGPAVEQGRTS